MLGPFMVDFLLRSPTTVGALSSIPLIEETNSFFENNKYLAKLASILVGIGSVTMAMKVAELSCALALIALQKESSRIHKVVEEKIQKTKQELKELEEEPTS